MLFSRQILDTQESFIVGSFLLGLKPLPLEKWEKFSPLRHSFLLILVVEWRRLSGFPVKITLVHALALLGIEKISLSFSSLVLVLESKAL